MGRIEVDSEPGIPFAACVDFRFFLSTILMHSFVFSPMLFSLSTFYFGEIRSILPHISPPRRKYKARSVPPTLRCRNRQTPSFHPGVTHVLSDPNSIPQRNESGKDALYIILSPEE